VKCSQRPIGVNAATDVSTQLPASGVALGVLGHKSRRQIPILTPHNSVRSQQTANDR